MQVRFIAEDALVDAVMSELVDNAGGAAASGHVTMSLRNVLTLLSNLATDIASVLPPNSSEARRLMDAFDPVHTHAELARAPTCAAQATFVTGLLRESAETLTRLGAPEREPPANAALGRINAMLFDAMSNSDVSSVHR